MLIEEFQIGKLMGVEGGDFDSSLTERLFSSILTLNKPFLLESGFFESKGTGRYTIMGGSPLFTFKAARENIVIENDGCKESLRGDPFDQLKGLLERFRLPENKALPFVGGAVGYIGYEAGEEIESMPERKSDLVIMPDLCFSFYDSGLVVDHLKKKIYLFASGFLPDGRVNSKKAISDISRMKELLKERPEADDGYVYKLDSLKSNFTRESYKEKVLSIKKYIAAGDIYQANLSQRFEADFNGSPYSVYRRMQKVNPVNFSAYLEYPEFSLISNSPERFLSVRKGRIETRPIKGTIRRSHEVEDDRKLVNDLKESKKDGAEHLMIVDLVRNDLGRVCRYGTVKVEELKKIETYSNLHHMVSVVSGELKDGVHAVDCIRAAFPGGSITGAPKVRAMEVIHEVEPSPRWVYTGSVGYIGFDGSMDLNIAIRTAFVKKGKIYFSSGGGIVADSDPDAEYEETLLKGDVFRRIISGEESS